MAKSLAKPLKRSWPDEADEFESAAMLALVEAAQSFDPERGVKFATFARYRIWGALRDVQRDMITAGWRGDTEHMPTVTSLTYNSEEVGTVLGCHPDHPVGFEIETSDWMDRVLRTLPGRHRLTCELIYCCEMTQGEAAGVIGVSKSRLSYLHKEALEILRFYFEDEQLTAPSNHRVTSREVWNTGKQAHTRAGHRVRMRL